MSVLTAYGHSWVGGAGAGSAEARLVNRVAGTLGLEVDNRGVGGTASTQTAELVRRQPPPPSVAFLIMTGLNDLRLHGESVDALSRYRQAVAGILDAVVLATAAAGVAVGVAVVEQPRLLDYSGYAPHDHGSDDLVDRYNRVMREVASRYDRVTAVQVSDWDPHSMLDDDAVHPNDSGHRAIARAVEAALAGVVVSS